MRLESGKSFRAIGLFFHSRESRSDGTRSKALQISINKSHVRINAKISVKRFFFDSVTLIERHESVGGGEKKPRGK